MAPLLEILLLSLLGSVIALSGGVVFLLVKPWSRVLTRYSVPFAAGVLVTAALLGLLPEALELTGDNSLTVVLATLVGAYLFEAVFCDLHHHDHQGKKLTDASVPLVIAGDSVHNFIDGVGIAAAWLVNPGLGLVTALSTFLHEVPHEIGDFGILLRAGFKKWPVFWINLGSSLLTPVGALLVYGKVNQPAAEGYLLAVAAGMFLYLGLSDFLPKAARSMDKLRAALVLVTGAGLMFLILKLVPHRL